MTLTQYIKSTRGNGAALARALGISPSHLSQIAKDSSGVSPDRCVAIVRATGGAVTLKELRPKDWRRIWPQDAKDAEWDGITDRRTGPADRRKKSK